MEKDVKERLTLLLNELRSGSGEAEAQLYSELYGQLHKIAASLFSSQSKSHTLQPTALVNEAYLKLARSPSDSNWNDRAHFLNVAARAMRQVLINHAREKNADKRGGNKLSSGKKAWQQVTLSGVALKEESKIDFLALNDELEKLARLDARQSQIAELRLFGDLSTKEISEILEMPQRTVQLDWKMARNWLVDQLDSEGKQ